MEKDGYRNNGLLLKLVSGFIISGMISLLFIGDFRSLVSWVMSFAAALLIAALFYWLLRPVKTSETENSPETLSSEKTGAVDKANASARAISEQTSNLAIGSAEVSAFVDKLAKSIVQDQEYVNRISESCEHLSSLTDMVDHQVIETAEFTQSALTTSNQGRLSVEESSKVMSTLREEVDQGAEQLKSLQHMADKIKGIADVINGVADQTKLLALNATIEAARAGEAGKGFGVVADEVRELASKTASATRDIEAMLKETGSQIKSTATIMGKVVERTVQMTGTMETVDESFSNIASAVSKSSDAMEKIRGFLDGQVESVGQITSSISHVLDSMKETSTSGQSVSEKAMTVSNSAERIFELLIDFEVDTFDKTIIDEAKQAVEQIQSLFERAVEDGRMTMERLFSKNFRPIPNTNPQKYHSEYDEFTDRELPKVQEPILKRHPEVLYAVAMDTSYYVPTCNDYLCKPLTGDYETDLVNNRTKKKYDDRCGKRASENVKPFLLQTYKRDMGDVMHDLSVPLHVNGRHWGCFRIGYKPHQD